MSGSTTVGPHRAHHVGPTLGGLGDSCRHAWTRRRVAVSGNTIDNLIYYGIQLTSGTGDTITNTVFTSTAYGIGVKGNDVRAVIDGAWFDKVTTEIHAFASAAGAPIRDTVVVWGGPRPGLFECRRRGRPPVVGGPSLPTGQLERHCSGGVDVVVAPGAALKSGHGRDAEGRGIVDRSGTAEGPVVFTSIKDDTVGGTPTATAPPAHRRWVVGPGYPQGLEPMHPRCRRLSVSLTPHSHSRVGPFR